MTEAPQIVVDIETFVRRTGHAPSAAEIYAIANFREPGGIQRITEGLAWFALKRPVSDPARRA